MEENFKIELWEKDQSVWSEDSITENTTTQKSLKEKNYIHTMESSQEISIRNNHEGLLQLHLKQTKNDIKQLNIHLTTLQSLDEAEEVAEKIADIQLELNDLETEKHKLEKEIEETREITSLFKNKIEIPK